MSNPNKDSVDLAKDEALRQRKGGQAKQMILWFAALIVGAILGWMQIPALNELFNFVATVFTRLFQFIAVPTIALAVITTLSALGAKKDTGRIFAHAVTYTLLTTISAAAIGLILYLWILVCRQTVPKDAGIAYIVMPLGAVVIDVALDGID